MTRASACWRSRYAVPLRPPSEPDRIPKPPTPRRPGRPANPRPPARPTPCQTPQASADALAFRRCLRSPPPRPTAPVPPGQRIKPRSPAVTYVMPTCPARPKPRPGLHCPTPPAAAVLPAATASPRVARPAQASTNPRLFTRPRRSAVLAAPVPAPRFFCLSFLRGCRYAAPGCSGLRFAPAADAARCAPLLIPAPCALRLPSRRDRRASLGLAFCSRPVTALAAMHFT